MSEKKVVLITGAGRGMGVDIARAALDAGHRVVATARNADRVTQALGTPTASAVDQVNGLGNPIPRSMTG